MRKLCEELEALGTSPQPRSEFKREVSFGSRSDR
jgi:hypothetical protein